MKIFVFGNENLNSDSLPLRILPELKKRFPEFEFEIKDPNEELDFVGPFLILDTVEGTDDVALFNNLEAFVPSPRVTMHDFDAYANLRFLKKVKELPSLKIIGVPPKMPEGDALEKVGSILCAVWVQSIEP